jgi:hypothetical protein
VIVVPDYFRAYRVSQLRMFTQFRAAPNTARLADSELLYLDSTLAVRREPTASSDDIFGFEGAEWQAFCGDNLGFAVPDWDREAAEVRTELGIVDDRPVDRCAES